MNKALTVLAVVAILGASFFAGQKSFEAVEYEHAEVIDAISGCSDDEFIGACKPCQECGEPYYAAGGCSYFKDTLCTLCTPIAHCPTMNIDCTDQYDQVCAAPGCDPTYYIDMSVGGKKCSPCTICPSDHFVVTPCQMAADTVCKPCHQCGESEWVSTVCKVDVATGSVLPEARQGVMEEGDTECTACLPCPEGTFCDAVCDAGDIHTLGAPTSCANCEECPQNKWASSSCSIGPDEQTGCTDCSMCKDDEFIIEQCDQGSPFVGEGGAFLPNILGKDTLCQGCTERAEGQWTVFPCNPLHTSDAIHQDCTTCKEGEYQFSPCTEFADAVCPACPDSADTLHLGDPDFQSGLQYCKMVEGTARSEVRCKAIEENGQIVAGKSVCGQWSAPGTLDQRKCRHPWNSDKVNCGTWTSYCQDGFSGDSCCYHKYPMNCGTLTSRERNGRRNGFIQGEDFVGFCRELCDEFPDCLAFEIKMTGDKVTQEDCYFKASYTQNEKLQWVGFQDNWACFSNTCRQNNYVTNPDTINYSPRSEKRARIPSTIEGGRRR